MQFKVDGNFKVKSELVEMENSCKTKIQQIIECNEKLNEMLS